MKILLLKDLKCLSRIFEHDVITCNTNFFFNEYDNIKDSEDDIIKKASFYEKEYNIYAIDAIQADRHLGRYLAYSAPNYAKSELSQKANYIKSLNLFNKAIEYWVEVLSIEKINLIAGVRSGLVGKCYSIVARKLNIPQRYWIRSRYRDWFHWATNEYDDWPGLKETYETTLIETEPMIVRLSKDVYERINSMRTIKGFFYYLYLVTKKYLSSKIKKRVKMGNHYLSEDIKYLFRFRKNIVLMKKTSFKRKKKYIIFPLQMEPETTLNLMCPEFNNQISIIDAIVKNLQCDVTLMVKEHMGGLGHRPNNFYDYLKKLPNVEFVSIYEDPIELIRNSLGVVFINSSMGYEAAFLGIPSITLNNKSNISFLPHVKFSSLNNLRQDLKDMITAGRNESAGKRFLTAVLKTSGKEKDCYELLMKSI